MINDSYLNSIEQSIIILREVISKQSGVNLDDIINSDSLRGAELTRVLNGNLVAISPKDTLIIFELREDNMLDLDVEIKDELTTINSYKFVLVIYGENSRTISKILKSRLLSQQVVNKLQNQGISIMNISNIESTSEIINNVKYLRRDLTLTVVFALKVDKIDDVIYVENVETKVSQM